ncbi:MAG: polysaccharide deacetylase family protein [Candidatus Omnitrophota bacterium]
MRKFKKIKIIFGVIIVLFLAFAGFIRQHYVVPIIMYHSVNPSAKPQNRLAITDAAFERQMRFLKEHHYNVLPLEDLARLIKGKIKIPPKTTAITFDDGYRDNYIYAFPILKKYNLPATIFIIVNEVGRPQGDKLSWDEIKEMQASGLITIGSHTLTHKYLEEIKTEGELRKEVFDSKRILEDKLSRQVNIFSYPSGTFTPLMRGLVIEAGYKLAAATNPGKNYPNNDIFALKRLRISSTSDNLFVFWFETTGYYTFFKERRHK